MHVACTCIAPVHAEDALLVYMGFAISHQIQQPNCFLSLPIDIIIFKVAWLYPVGDATSPWGVWYTPCNKETRNEHDKSKSTSKCRL
jgi:hypothetical protein